MHNSSREISALQNKSQFLSFIAAFMASSCIGAPSQADELVVPSGQVVTLLDVITNIPGPEGLTTRFRFLAPAIARDGGTVDAEAAAADMDFLCQSYALAKIANTGPQPEQIIISMSDVDVPFGEARPEATQFFNSYSIADGSCVWDVY
jgi:Family of unknown function (DUF6497)